MKSRPIFLTPFIPLFLFLVGVLISAAPAQASATITVTTTLDELNDDGQCSLREAIGAANLDTASGATPGECPAGSGADTITFASNVTGSVNILPSSLPLPMVTDTLSIVGPGTTVLQVYLARTGTVLAFNGQGKTFSLSGLSVTGLGASTEGISLGSGLLTIDSVTIRNNAGSGLFIFRSGMVTIANSTIADNISQAGGGIQNLGTLIVKNSTLSGNSAGFGGGGIYNTGATAVINTIIYNNSGGGYGTIGGGGIYNGGLLTLINSTISGNSAPSNPDNNGGGIYSSDALTITNSTIVSNTTSGLGGGLRVVSGPVAIHNTIIARSVAGGDCSNGGATITNDGNNIVEDNSCGFAGGVDPMLGPLQDNGGPTWTYALLPGSPAIDAGNNATCATTDQRGGARPVDGDGNGSAICDIGAYEFGALIPTAWLYLPLVLRGP